MSVQFLKVVEVCKLYSDLSRPPAFVVVDGCPTVPREALYALMVVVLVLLNWDFGVGRNGAHELWEPLVDGTFDVQCGA